MKKGWRIVKKKRLHDAFSGEGARLGGGRWNHVGTPVIYVSETLSLAAIERFVNFTRKDIIISKSLYSISIEIPDSLKIIEVSVKDLNPDWKLAPPANFTKDIGTEWARNKTSPILRVPSAIIPNEYNLIINPAHPEFKKIKAGKPEPFTLDERMRKH